VLPVIRSWPRLDDVKVCLHTDGGLHETESVNRTVTKLRALSRRQLQRKAFLAKWSAIDWLKQDVELATETGLSPERIRQIRQEVGAPKSPHQHRPRETRQKLQWASENLDKLKGLCQYELEQKYGLKVGWRRDPLYRLLKPFLRNGRFIRKHRWDLMNFELPSLDLERIWTLCRNEASSYRYRNRLPPPLWSIARVHPQFIGRRQFQAYHRAVRAEKRKAARYFAQARRHARVLSSELHPYKAQVKLGK
jgi:hypothetical protein